MGLIQGVLLDGRKWIIVSVSFSLLNYMQTMPFSQYLETLCDLLYDDLRPRILHEPRLTVLCEVCTVLQALMVLDTSSLSSTSSSAVSTDGDSSSEEEDSDSEEDASGPLEASSSSIKKLGGNRRSRRSDDELTIPAPGSPTPSHVGSSSLSQKTNTARLGKRLHIGHLLKMVLQDAQTKLFFKAQAVIQSDIRHFVPKEEDLKWPGVLVCEFDYSFL